MKKTKFLWPLFSLVLLAGCASTSSSGSSEGTSTTGGIEDVINTSESSDLFAYEAATSIGLLATIDTTTVKAANRAVSETLVDQITSYLPSIEAALRGEEILLQNRLVPSDRTEYEYKLEVQYQDIAAEDVSFTMYYNETPLVEDDFDDRFDDEEESRIDGLVVIDDAEFAMRGTKEREDDELEVSFSYHIDDSNYVRVSQEIERGEQEFQYEVYENRRMIHSYSLEMENDEVELHSESIGSNLYLEFAFFRQQERTLIRCNVVENGQRERLLFEKVVQNDGTILYQLVS